jgi:hypothetical protein
MAGGFLQQGRKALGDRTVRQQDILEHDRAGSSVPVEDAGVEAGFVAEGSVEAGRVDAERIGHLGDAQCIISARVEQALRGRHSIFRIETARPAARAGYFFISHYIILDAVARPVM